MEGRELLFGWISSGLIYGERASSPPRDWPFDRALLTLLVALEESVDWRTWWESSNRRPLKLWIDLLTTLDMRERLAKNEISVEPRVRRSRSSVRVDCAVDVEAARVGTAERQREAAIAFLAGVLATLNTASLPPLPEIPPASALEEDYFLARHRARSARRKK